MTHRNRIMRAPRKYWTAHENKLMRELYPDLPTRDVAKRLGRKINVVYHHARVMGIGKSEAFWALPASGRIKRNEVRSRATQFKPGCATWNKGKHYNPGGRSVATRFKKGQRPANYMEVGTLRQNADGYVDMKIRDAPGRYAWRGFHRVLWEDAHGPIPGGHCVCFKDGDKLNLDIDNLELRTMREHRFRNSFHQRIPQPLRSTIHALGQLKRRIREKQNRGSKEPPVRHA